MPDDAPHCDPKRFDECVASVSPESVLAVIGWEMGRLRAHCEPEDIWQEALALAWRDRGQHRWEGPRAYRAWLLGIAKNRIRDVVKALDREKRGGGARPKPFSGLDLGDDASLSDLLPAGSTTPSRIAGSAEAARIVRQAIDDLPEGDRDVIRLHLLEEVPLEEVARRLGLASHVVRYRFLKASEAYARKLKALRSMSRPGSAT